ncbi:MAG: DUF4886 domain-containing protein [Akkermansiaceae bacterium]
MKLLALILPILLFCSSAHLSADDSDISFRTWKSTAGTSIEAQLAKRNPDGSVTLIKKDGSTLKVALRKLSAEDQRYLKELEALKNQPKRILFIGNSYTGGIKGMVTRLVAASPYSECELSFINPGGRTLKQHLENDATMQKIRDGKWDIVVLQDQSQTPAVFPDKFLTAAVSIDEIIDESKAKTVFYETWGRRDGDKRNPSCGTFIKMQKALSDSYEKATKKCDAKLAPVGKAWAILRKANPALGEKLYKGDGSHPASPGSYLAACVFYGTLFGADPSTVDFDGGLPADQVSAIRAAVKEALK